MYVILNGVKNLGRLGRQTGTAQPNPRFFLAPLISEESESDKINVVCRTE